MSKFLNFDTNLFIMEVQKRPVIWDTSVDHNKEIKKKAWAEINDVFGGENMTQADKHLLEWRLQQRWKNLRTCFAREIKRQRNYGAGTGRKSEYVYYKNLLFLRDVMNITAKDVNELQYVYFDDNVKGLSHTTVKHYKTELPRKCVDNTSTNKKGCKRKTFEYEEPFSDEDEDEDRLFLLSLHKTLKRVPRNKKIDVKIKMLSILSETIP